MYINFSHPNNVCTSYYKKTTDYVKNISKL